MKKLNIMITPSYESTRDAMGFSEEEDYNSDAVLFQQGYDTDVLIVEPDDKFRIEKDFKGEISCEEIPYKFIKLKEEWEDDFDDFEEDYIEDGDPINLHSGYYHFLEDGKTIKELS